MEYELVERDFIAGQWPQKTNIESKIASVFLVQMLDDRTIKTEVFQGKKASQVSGFTENARTYTERFKLSKSNERFYWKPENMQYIHVQDVLYNPD